MRNRTALLSAALPLLSATTIFADVIDTTWLGGAGSWNDPTKWSGGLVPNNSGTTTFRVNIPSGTVTGGGSAPITVDRVDVGAGGTLSLATSLVAASGKSNVDGFMKVITRFQLTGAGKVTGLGTIDVAYWSGAYAGLVGTEGLEIGDGLTVQSYLSGFIGLPTKPLVNRGRIVGGYEDHWFCPYLSFSTVVNEGVIEARNGHLVVGSTQGQPFTRADLGSLVTGPTGTVLINGTLANVGQVLNVDASNHWGLLRGGVIQGGTIEIAAGERFEVRDMAGGTPATLDGVTVNGRLYVGGRLDIKNGVLAGSARVGLTTIYDTSGVLTSSSGALTIGSGVTVRPEYDDVTAPIAEPVIGDATGPVTNHGLIGTALAAPQSSGGIRVRATAFGNNGVLSQTGSFNLTVRGLGSSGTCLLTFGTGGTLQAFVDTSNTSGLLDITGSLDLTTTGDALQLTRIAQLPIDTFYRIVRTTTGVVGTFDSITPGWEPDYRGNEIWVRYIPEPLSSFALGLGSLLIRRPRREDLR